MANKSIYLTDDQKHFIRYNSANINVKSMAAALFVPESEIMRLVVQESLPFNVDKKGRRREKAAKAETEMFEHSDGMP
jgi:hypothetical protein